MEFSLLVYAREVQSEQEVCFNPCCNGIQSVGAGRCSCGCNPKQVSILVVMEFSLLAIGGNNSIARARVSILVVMEFSLLVEASNLAIDPNESFNPCCNGIQSVGWQP